jgi:hypothetical protein
MPQITAHHTAPITAAACLFNDDDALCIDKLAIILGVRYPDVEWEALEADGQPFALLSQPASSRGGALAMMVQQAADGTGWSVVCDDVALIEGAQSAGRAALEAGLEVGLQCLLGVA